MREAMRFSIRGAGDPLSAFDPCIRHANDHPLADGARGSRDRIERDGDIAGIQQPVLPLRLSGVKLGRHRPKPEM